MTGFVRSLLSLLLLLVAVGSALGGVAAQWLDGTARTAAPMQEIVGRLSSDERVKEAIAVELTTAAVAQLPAVVDSLPGVRSQMEALITRAVVETLSSEGITAAWYEAIDLSRADFVDALDLMRSGGDAPTLWLYLDPFVDLGLTRLVEISPEILRPVVAELRLPEDLRIALGRPDTVQAGYAADALEVARHWIWFYAVAAALAVVGLAVGSRRGRWVACALAVGLGVAVLTLGRRALASPPTPGGESLAAVVQASLVEGTAESLLSWTAPAVTVGWALLALAVAALLVASMRRTGR